MDFYAALLVVVVLEGVEFDHALGFGGGHQVGNIIHNTASQSWLGYRHYELRIMGTDWTGFSTPVKTAPARPKMAPPSCHNVGVALRGHRAAQEHAPCADLEDGLRIPAADFAAARAG